MKEKQENLYKVLGVTQDVHLYELKKEYMQKLTEFHPDNNPMADNIICQEMIYNFNMSYYTLRNMSSRMVYDKNIGINTIEENSINKKKYNSYYEYDYTNLEQKEFIEWLEEFRDSYVEWLLLVNKNEKLENNELIVGIATSFDNIITYEKDNIPKKENDAKVTKIKIPPKF